MDDLLGGRAIRERRREQRQPRAGFNAAWYSRAASPSFLSPAIHRRFARFSALSEHIGRPVGMVAYRERLRVYLTLLEIARINRVLGTFVGYGYFEAQVPRTSVFLIDKRPIYSQIGSSSRWNIYVRVVSRRKLREHWETQGREDSEQSLKTWYSVVSKAEWKTYDDIKAAYGAKVDLAHGKNVFNVKANDYRLSCVVDFVRHGVLVLWIGTYKEYDTLNQRKGERLRQL